jgi:2-dehydro-3-deoxyphosphogluconate aldolase / (4S)-4-hydroxy-2-oxoglutarate aldolase
MITDRPELPAAIRDERLVIVARGPSPEQLLAAAVVTGAHGFHVIEVTLDSESPLEGIERLRLADGLTVGAGTVSTSGQARQAIEAGATFVVTPTLEAEVLEECVRSGVACIPGAFSPTEVRRAWQLGAAAVKIFPAGALGPDYLAALRGPLSDIPMVPTGGITGGDVPAYLDAGAIAVGLGGWLPLRDLDELDVRAGRLSSALAAMT